MTPLRVLMLVFLSLFTLACDGGAPTDEGAPAADGAVRGGEAIPADGALHLLSFARIQGFEEGWPCQSASPTPLAAAARVRRQLEETGDAVRLVLIGDALRRPGSITLTRAAREGARARAEVIMDAMVEAGVGIWVPSHGDLGLWGGDGLFDRASKRGLTLLATNVDTTRPGLVSQSLIVRAGTLRVALLGAIPLKSTDSEERFDDDDSFTIARPVRRLLEVSERIMDAGEADMVVVLSSLPGKSNQKLAESEDIHFIVGSTEPKVAADRIVLRYGTGMMFQRPNGRELSHTTFRVVDGDFDMVDLSPLWALPPVLEEEARNLAEWQAIYGTNDPSYLAPRVSPGLEEDFMMKFQLHFENLAWIEEWTGFQGPSVAHRAAELPADEPGDAVVAVLAMQGPAIRAAAEGVGVALEPIFPETEISDPEACVECHEQQYRFWRGTDHSRAWTSLQAVDRHRDTSCLLCHAAGFGMPGGFDDPRHDAPFGGVACFSCHGTKSYHYVTKRGVVEPASNPMRTRESIMATCGGCHTEERSPGFDTDSAMAATRCPPMRVDDPALINAYDKALKSVERNRQEGTAVPRDDLFEARALLGLGREEEAVPLLKRYSLELIDFPAAAVELAMDLDHRGRSRDALEILRNLLGYTPSEPQLAMAYAELLLEARDESVRDAVTAAAYLAQVAPYDLDTKMDSRELPLRLLQVEAMYEAGRAKDGEALLVFLASNFRQSEEIEVLLDRYLTR